MSISEQHIKLLWGRAAGLCSFPDCRIKLTQDKKLASVSFPLGEQAHIVGLTKNSPRGRSNLTKKERDPYFNLILLCPTHHTLIDKNPDDYTVEKLHYFKDQHEYWVEHKFSESKDSLQTAQSVIYADLIDATVEACQFDSWTKWASRALSTTMNWDEDSQNRLFDFYNKIIGAIWPKTLPELECALKKLTYEIWQAINTFSEHCDLHKTKDGILVEDMFYKSRGWIEDHELYQQLFKEYDAWQSKCRKHVVAATKAVNWFAVISTLYSLLLRANSTLSWALLASGNLEVTSTNIPTVKKKAYCVSATRDGKYLRNSPLMMISLSSLRLYVRMEWQTSRCLSNGNRFRS